MNADKFRDQLSDINFGHVLAAAARDYQKEVAQQQTTVRRAPAPEDVDLDELLDDPELEKLHIQRLAALKRDAEKRQELQRKGHGEYRDVAEEDFLGEVTTSERVVAHFYHQEFVRCKVMDKHLRGLALQHLETKFIRVDAERCPFFVAKLAIKVLPCVIFFRDGVACGRVVGFEELGGKDDFAPSTLVKRLRQEGLLLTIVTEEKEEKGSQQRNIRSGQYDDSDSD